MFALMDFAAIDDFADAEPVLKSVSKRADHEALLANEAAHHVKKAVEFVVGDDDEYEKRKRRRARRPRNLSLRLS